MTCSCELHADHGGSLTAGSVGPSLIALAWPILCCGIAEVFDASINVMWVGRELGDVALAALSNANLLWGLVFVAAFGVTIAGTVWVGRSLGEGDVQGAKVAVRIMVGTSIVVSVACGLPMIVWPHFLLECLGTPAVALPQAVVYLRILLLAVPAMYVNAAVIATLQAAGDSKMAFYLAVAGVLIDAALNPVLILGVWPFPALGIAGSALATLISQIMRLTALLIQVYGTGHPMRLLGDELNFLRMDWIRVMALIRDGGPMAAQALWPSAERMLMISLVNRFGADVTAAYGAVVQLWNLIMMPGAALGVAITAIVAQNMGAGRWDRVRSATRFGLMQGVLATVVLVALVETLSAPICGIFLPAGSPALAFAAQINREATWSLVPLGGYMVWVGVLRAMGSVWAPLGISGLVLAVRFPVTAALLGRWQTHAIWWSFPASAAATAVLAALHAYWGAARARRAAGLARRTASA